MALTTHRIATLIVAATLAFPAAADPDPNEEVVIYQGGEEPRSGGKVPEATEPTDEVIIYKGGEAPRSGGKVGGVMAGPDGQGDMRTGPLPF